MKEKLITLSEKWWFWCIVLVFVLFITGIESSSMTSNYSGGNTTNYGRNDSKYEEKEEYTITFYNDGKKVQEVVVKKGELVEKPENPTKDGYEFSHWATHEKSIDGSEKYDFSIAPTKSITLYAHFTKIKETSNQNNTTDNTNNNSTSKPNNSVSNNSNTNNNTANNSNDNSATNKPNNSVSNTDNTNNNTSNNSSNTSSISVSKQNALKSAKSYLGVSAFSRKGLIEQLEYEKFSNEDAVYAVDNCGANWNEQALKSAKSYLSVSAFSKTGLIEQLEYEGFTNSQANYGVSNCGANWNEQAAKSAKSYLSVSSFSRDDLIEQLEYEGFTHEQAVYGVSQTGL